MKRIGVVLVVMLFLLICCILTAGCILPESPSESDNGPYFVLDTDPGTDDAIAYLLWEYYIPSDSMVIGTAGNVPLDLVHTNIFLLHDYLESKSLLFYGASGNLAGDPIIYDEFCGPDGLGNMSGDFKKHMWEKYGLSEEAYEILLKMGMSQIKYDAITQIGEGLMQQDSITYVVLGPQTTLAQLIMAYPELVDKMDQVYIMGGGFNITNAPHDTEFNFASDPMASAIVFGSGLNITLVPLDLTTSIVLTADQIQGYKDSGNYPEMVGILEYGHDAAISTNQSSGFMLHDPSTVVCAAHPEAFTFKDTHITIDEYGATRESDDGYPVRLAISMNQTVISAALADIFGVADI